MADQLDELIGSFKKAEQKLEEAAASNTIAKISADELTTYRLLAAVNRLIDILNAFLRSFQAHFGSGQQEAYPPPLPGATKTLKLGKESSENQEG
jgi:hypothetical protein